MIKIGHSLKKFLSVSRLPKILKSTNKHITSTKTYNNNKKARK
jgi:hypothetical protein